MFYDEFRRVDATGILLTFAAAAAMLVTLTMFSAEARASELRGAAAMDSPANPPARTEKQLPGLRGTVVGTLRPQLSGVDRIATLEALQIALTEVSDGSTYVWHRAHGRLSGIIRPTASYAGENGRICRKLHVTLTSGILTKTLLASACRDQDGEWILGG